MDDLTPPPARAGSAGPSAPFGRAEPKSGAAQPTDELPALDDLRSGGDHLVSILLGDVVVVTLEPSTRDPDPVGELDEFLVRHIGDEVTPPATLEPPAGFVHEDRHRVEHATPCHTRGVSTPAERGDDPPRTPLDEAWRRHVSTDTALLTRLVGRHREKHRRYHDVAHVEAVVGAVIGLDALEPAVDLGAVVAAAMYHDAVYEPASPANERASARLARRDLATLGWEPERVTRVAHMIEATSDHLAPPDHDHALLFDADLGILGADPRAYAAYADAVRAEYRHVDDDVWRVGRCRVLESLLERAEIYATATGRDRWEAAARTNMTDELESLNG